MLKHFISTVWTRSARGNCRIWHFWQPHPVIHGSRIWQFLPFLSLSFNVTIWATQTYSGVSPSIGTISNCRYSTSGLPPIKTSAWFISPINTAQLSEDWWTCLAGLDLWQAGCFSHKMTVEMMITNSDWEFPPELGGQQLKSGTPDSARHRAREL